MNELVKVFENEEFGNVRVVEENNKILFCGSDIAKALGYSNANKAILDHCKDITKRDTPTAGGIQSMSFITEGDIYRLIIKSKLPSAEKFESWVFDEVLPSIKENGMYATEQTIDKMISNPDFAIKLLTKLKEEQQARVEVENQNKVLQAEIVEQKPKVDFADRLLKTKDNILVREFVKVISDEGYTIGEKKMFKWLRDNKFLMTNNEPYQKYVDNHTFLVKTGTINTTFGEKQTRTTLITPKGQLYLFGKYEEYIKNKQ